MNRIHKHSYFRNIPFAPKNADDILAGKYSVFNTQFVYSFSVSSRLPRLELI